MKPPYKLTFRHVWRCLTRWRAWRRASAVDSAYCVLWNAGYYDVAMSLEPASQELWDEVLK